MNRRSFISTLTALAGLALAKIKAPAKDYLRFKYNGYLPPPSRQHRQGVIAGEQIRAGDAVYIKDGKMYKSR